MVWFNPTKRQNGLIASTSFQLVRRSSVAQSVQQQKTKKRTDSIFLYHICANIFLLNKGQEAHL